MAANPNKALGEQISRLRKNLKLTQKDLASQMGIGSPQIISQIEKGEREVKAWELAKLSKFLFVSLSDLLASEEPEAQPAVLWRVLPSSQITVKEARFLKRCKQYGILEDLSGTTRPREFPQKKVDPIRVNYRDAASLAEEIRGEFGLGDRPAAAIEKTLGSNV